MTIEENQRAAAVGFRERLDRGAGQNVAIVHVDLRRSARGEQDEESRCGSVARPRSVHRLRGYAGTVRGGKGGYVHRELSPDHAVEGKIGEQPFHPHQGAQ